ECTPMEIAEILRETMPFVSTDGQQISSLHVQHSESRQTQRRDKQEQVAQQEQQQQQQIQFTSNSNVNQQAENAEILSAVKEVYPQINETLEAVLLDSSMKTLIKIPVSDVVKKLNSTEGAKILVLDGIVTQRLVEAAYKAGIEYIVGHRMSELKKSTDVRVRTFGEMGISN
ncbi:MAG TPA: hypothetical protein VFJ51_02775, partial [Nitrososphaeraceae archaeon]|nr:hypothetical protein [Nitrososphaeraceae archaeon]